MTILYCACFLFPQLVLGLRWVIPFKCWMSIRISRCSQDSSLHTHIILENHLIEHVANTTTLNSVQTNQLRLDALIDNLEVDTNSYAERKQKFTRIDDMNRLLVKI